MGEEWVRKVGKVRKVRKVRSEEGKAPTYECGT